MHPIIMLGFVNAACLCRIKFQNCSSPNAKSSLLSYRFVLTVVKKSTYAVRVVHIFRHS